MANTTKINLPFIDVLFDGATDWDIATDPAFDAYMFIRRDGLRVVGMQMIPSASQDACVVRNSKTADATKAKIKQFLASSKFDQAQRVGFAGGQYSFPSILASEVTAGVQLIIEVKA